MERYFIAPDDIRDENGGLLFRKGQRVQSDERSPAFAAEALEKMGLVDERQYKAPEPGALEAVNTLVDETARGNLGELFEDPTGEDSTPVHILKSAGKGLVSSVAHGVTGFEKGIVGGALDLASAGARVLGGDKLADDLQRAKRFNDRMMDLKPLDDALLGDDPGRAAWDAMMGVSEGLGAIAGGVAGAKPLAAALKGAKLAKTAEGAMKAAFTAQMAAGGEEAARTAILTKKDEHGNPVVDEDGQPVIENRDLTWRERAEVGYHTLKEGITAQFFGKVVGAFGKKIGNAGAAALEFGGINAAGVLADAYIGDNIAGREWKDENGNILAGNEKDQAVLAKAGAAFAYGGMQSLLMSMGGAIAGRRSGGAEAGREARPARPTEDLAAARQKAAAAMVQAAADPESAAVAARGANGETLMKNGCLVRAAEDGAAEVVTPDGVVLDAEGKVKTVAAGNIGETGEGAYGTAITVRMNPMTGRPTAARETVRNALVALEEGVTADQLREIDGWTPENKAVFETVARLKAAIEGGETRTLAGTGGARENEITVRMNLAPEELVDAYAGLGLGKEELRAYGLLPNTPEAHDAAEVALLGTRQLAEAVVRGPWSVVRDEQSVHEPRIPLEIAAEVARSVNAGTTGLMPKELAKRQLETARQILSERRASALQESAAEHGNTPEAERAVLDTPVEREDGTLQPLGRLEANSEEGIVNSSEPGSSEGNSSLSTIHSSLPGTSNTLRARHEREQSVKALGLKPLGDGSYGVGRFPQMRVEKADGVADETGRPVSAIRVTGLDPAEMLRPENILDAARVLGDLMEKCAAKGVRVDFEPEAMDAVNEVMAKWETDVRTDPVLRARSEVVTSLLEKSGLASGIVTDQAGFEAALREAGGDKAEKLIVDGLTYGFTDGDKVYLNPAFFGTKVGLNTPIHEFGHLGIIACRKINRPLYDRGIDLIKQTKYWQEVTEHPDYKNDNPVKNAEEALTRLIADRGEKLSAETPKGVLAEIKQWLVDFWKTFGNALGLREITPEQVEKMTVDQIADAIRAEMLRGERFGTSRAQAEAQQQGGRRLKAGQRKRSPKSYIEAGGGKASKAFIFWAENGKRIMNVPKPGEFGWDLYNQLVLGVKDPAERARVKRILCGDQPKNTRLKGNDEILAEFNRRMGGDGDIYTNESGFQQMVEEFLASHADYEKWRAEGAKSAEEMEAEAVVRDEQGAHEPRDTSHETPTFDPAELEEWGRMYDESRLAMAEAGLRDEPDARVSDDAMWARGVVMFSRGVAPSALGDGKQKYYEVPFDKAVDKIVKNRKPIGNEHVFISETPGALKEIGIPALPVMMNQSHILSCYYGKGEGVKAGNMHGLGDRLKSLPKALSRPMMVIANDSNPSSSVIAIVKMLDRDGHTVIVPVEINGIGELKGGQITANIVKTAFGKRNIWSEKVAKALRDEVDGKVGVFYVDGNEARGIESRLAREAFNFGVAERQLLRRAKGTVHSVSDYGSPVKGVGAQTDSQQFKRWFADSKVVDRAGRPRVVYHGTPNGKFWIFDKNRIGETWNADETGFFFTSDRKIAEDYTKPYFRENSADPNLFAVYLSIKNPLVIDRNWWQRNYGRSDIYNHDAIEIWDNEQGTILDEMRKGGHDGVIIDPNPMGGAAKMYMVPEPTQIKSATDNIGTFDPGNPDIRFSRGGYRPGDWRKTFTFGKAARGEAERTNGGEAAGEERRRWEENPVDERIPEWDAPQRNPNVAKPFALSAAEGVRLVKLLGGTMKKPKAYKDAIGVIDESDEQRIRDDLKAMGFFKGDDFLWAATATPAEVAADRAESQAALDARLEKLGEQRLKGEAGGGNRGLVRVSMSQVADLVLSLPAETGGNLGNVRTLAQGIVRGFEKDRTPEQAAYYFEEARNLLDWFYGRAAESGAGTSGTTETSGTGARPNPRKILARAFGAFLEAPDAVAEHAPGLYREFVDAISRNDKLLHAFDAIRRTALGEGSAERVYAEIEAGRTARAEEAARRLADEVEKPVGSRLERAKDSFVYNFDDMHGPIFMHITRAQKRQLAELKASLKAGRITQADYDAATAAFRQAVQGLKIAELKVDRGTQNEIRQYLWDMSYVFELAKAVGVDPKDAQRYMDLRWIVSTGGRAGARGMSARDAQIVLDNMRRNMGDEAFARLEGVSAQFHAVREKNILDDPRLAAMIGQDRVDYFKNNVHYVRTERTRATPEELAKMEADRAAFRRENKGDDDVTAAMLRLVEKTGGRGGGIGNSTWGHALEGSVRDVKDRLAATWRNDTRLMAAMERNDFVIQMRDALLAAKAEGVHDLPGSRGVDYPQNARYGHIRYFENGKQRVLVVPRVLADGYRQVSDAMTGWSAWGKIAHGVFIDWNLAYTLRNMTRNMASNEANIVGMRADNATIVGNALLPGAGRAASMAAYQLARHLPSAAIRNPFVRAAWGEHVNAAYAGQAQRILELYLDPRKALERRAAAEMARLRGETGPAMELDADLELMRFMTKSGALIARWDEVQGAGRDADLFMQGRGLGPIYGEKGGAGAQPPSVAKKALNATTWIFRRNAQFNRDLELHAKITAALAIHEMQPGLTAEQVGIEVARRASIPHAERRGAQVKFINYAWNMFFNTALKGGLRFVGNVVRNPRLLGKMAAQGLAPVLFWKVMIAGGGLTKVIRSMFGGDDEESEKKARQAGLGWLLDYAQFMHDGSLAASPYLQRFYHWCPLGRVGDRFIGIATAITDELKLLLPLIDWAAAKLAPQPTDPTATLGDAVKRGVVGTFVPDIFARTPLVAAAQDLLGPLLFDNNPMDTYRGTHVYDNSLFQARGESVADAAAFGWEMGKQVWNDLGGRTIVRPRRNEIEVAEGSGAQTPSFAEKAWDIALNDIPVLSGVLGGSLRMTLTKEQRLDQIEREALAPIRAVKNRRSEEIMKRMLESPVANNGSETPEIKEKLDAWAERYGWDEAERGNVFARAFNGYQAATAAGQELAAQKKEKNRRVRYNKMPNSEKKAVEAAGLREILAE